MTEFKLVFTGAPGAGKTTAIAAISDRTPVATEVANSDPTLGKAMTTVGLDFGELDLGDGERVRLFGTPGQERFSFVWPVLARNALGIIVLVDHTATSPVEQAMRYVDAFRSMAAAPLVLGVGRIPGDAPRVLDEYADALAQRGLVHPVLAVDVRRRDDVLTLVDAALSQLEATLPADAGTR